jgi:hypothetical protein
LVVSSQLQKSVAGFLIQVPACRGYKAQNVEICVRNLNILYAEEVIFVILSVSRVELVELSIHVDMAPTMSKIRCWAKIIINNIL